jgi:very-short-patch-repair endonuclease
MKPCVVCGKMIKKKDSVMTMLYVCSDSCKSKRKSLLPKKATATSWRYWVKQGMTDLEAKTHVSKIQSERSPRCIEYWIKKGFSLSEANLKVSEYQQALGLKNLEKYSREERQQRTPFSEKYWIKKGYSLEEAKSILSKNADNTSLESYIDRYGQEQGVTLYTEMCDQRKQDYSLAGYQKTHGEVEGKRLWSKKYKNRHDSKKAYEFFEKLIEVIGNDYKIYTAGNNNGEYGVLNRELNEYYFYDFVVPDLKLCVEYHGDYWHCNPSKYDAMYKHTQSGMLAKDIWHRDNVKLNTITSERGFSVMVVWESDCQDAKFKHIMEKIDELKKNKNQE